MLKEPPLSAVRRGLYGLGSQPSVAGGQGPRARGPGCGWEWEGGGRPRRLKTVTDAVTGVWEAPLEGDVSWLCRWLLWGHVVNGEADGLAGEEERFSSRGVAPGSPFSWLKWDASLAQQTDSQTDSPHLSERGWKTGKRRQDREETCRAWKGGAAPGSCVQGRPARPAVCTALPASRPGARLGRGWFRLRKSRTSPVSARVHLLSRVH